ncbi:uncharacterized protein Ripalpha [Venturia canescens]|uniref:uncharacterized protein Ripalpha n=1 Tax=Venturia canescens TaxID=32260 RepID=UPI001C9C4F11|nr:uncharacterized protein LOC122408138 [Venturia canescens]
MANIEKSPSLNTKLRTKDAANKIKHGSPKLQEVLRKRCRQRMKEKRGQLFDRRRPGLLMDTDENEVHNALTEIVRNELSQLATMDIKEKNALFLPEYDESLTEEEALELEKEILAEEEQWILLEYEKLQENEAEMLALFAEDCLREIVICPLCEKGCINESENELTCSSCNLRLPLKVRVEDFGKILRDRTNYHSSLCCGHPSFMLLPENNTLYLYLMCETCLTFVLII